MCFKETRFLKPSAASRCYFRYSVKKSRSPRVREMQHVDSIDTEGPCRPPPKGLRVALSLLLVAPALFAFFLLVQDSIRRQLVGQSQGEVLLLGSDSSEHDTYAQIISTHRKVFPETFYDEAHPTTFKTHMDHGKAKMHVRVKAQSHLQEQMLKGSSKVTVIAANKPT